MILHDRDRAEDAVQTAMLRAWRDLPSLRDKDRFDAWLYRLVVRSCYDESRRHRSFQASVRIVSIEPGEPDRSAHLADRDQVERAFRRLPIEQRAIVVLHHYQDLPLTEVAVALGVPVGTVRSRLHYALQALRAAVDADERPAAPEGQLA